jgi:hypothetical protein
MIPLASQRPYWPMGKMAKPGFLSPARQDKDRLRAWSSRLGKRFLLCPHEYPARPGKQILESASIRNLVAFTTLSCRLDW